jgi:hypothetical protein
MKFVLLVLLGGKFVVQNMAALKKRLHADIAFSFCVS